MFSIVRVLLFGGLVGKFLGIVRELVSAWLFGTGGVAVSYKLAQNGFLLAFHYILAESLNGGFAPAYAKDKSVNPESARHLFGSFVVFCSVITILGGCCLYAFAKPFTYLLAPGLSLEDLERTSEMLKILAFAAPCYALGQLFSIAELAEGQGRIASIRASFQSIGLLAGTISAWYYHEAMYIPIGFTSAHFILLIFGFRSAAKFHLPVWATFSQIVSIWPAIKSIFKSIRLLLLVPLLLQMQSIIEKRVCSLVDPGLITAIDYAKLISDTATILLAAPFALAGLASVPTMSDEEFQVACKKSFKFIGYVTIPSAVLLFMLSELVVRILFARGAFNDHAVYLTTQLLSGTAICLPSQLIGYVSLKFLNARHRHLKVVIINAVAGSIASAINLFGYSDFGVLAIATSLACYGFILGFYALISLNLLGWFFREFRLLTEIMILSLLCFYKYGGFNIDWAILMAEINTKISETISLGTSALKIYGF